MAEGGDEKIIKQKEQNSALFFNWISYYLLSLSNRFKIEKINAAKARHQNTNMAQNCHNSSRSQK
jgi:hypothetical protein